MIDPSIKNGLLAEPIFVHPMFFFIETFIANL